MARGDGIHSHAWVEQDGLIVDITADQFDGVDQAVIVTRDRSWHHQFHGQETHVAGLAYFDQTDVQTMKSDYTLLKGHVDMAKGDPVRSSENHTNNDADVR